MEIIRLTAENITTYLDQAVAIQAYLVKETEGIEPDQFLATAADSNTYFIALEENGQLAGLGVLSKVVHPVRTNGYVNNIVVSPEFRGRGLFTTIMDELEQQAKEWGCERVELTCSREAVQGMYVKRGYELKDTNFYYLDVS